MRRRVRKISGLSIKRVMLFICIVLFICAFGVVIFMLKNARDTAEESYRNRIGELENELGSYDRKVYRSKDYIRAGTVLKPDLLEEIDIHTDSDSFAAAEDLGRVLLVDVKAGTEITKNILDNADEQKYLKEAEISFCYIPDNISEYDYVDVRLRFPDGTDYIVSSKKKVIGIDAAREKLYFYLSEEELLLLDSAFFDTLNFVGSELYLTKYIYPEKESPSVVNYIPTIPLNELIKDNPNIAEHLFGILSPEERVELENALASYSSDERTENEKNTVKPEEKSGGKGGSIWD